MVSIAFMFLLRALALFAIGAFVALCGVIYFIRAREHADMMAHQLSTAHPWRRLWLPARFYTSNRLLWQLRIPAAGFVIIGLVVIICAMAALVRGQ